MPIVGLVGNATPRIARPQVKKKDQLVATHLPSTTTDPDVKFGETEPCSDFFVPQKWVG
jgi:hypothetical protein